MIHVFPLAVAFRTVTLTSAIDYRSDAICFYQCLHSRQNEIAHSSNYGLLLHGPQLQLCTLTIYENVVFVRHINYLKKSP